MGLLLALLVIVGTRAALGEAQFAGWGWRIPFLLSVVLVAISVWIRLRLKESPAFRRIKQAGRSSRAAHRGVRQLGQAEGRPARAVRAGRRAGGVWYTGQYQALFFLTLQLKVDDDDREPARRGGAADRRAGVRRLRRALRPRRRKPIIVAGCVAAALCYFALFDALTRAANPALAEAQARVRSRCTRGLLAAVESARRRCRRHRMRCRAPGLVARSVRYVLHGSDGAVRVAVGGRSIEFPAAADEAAAATLHEALDAAGYPREADPARIDRPKVLGILVLLVLFAAMVYGPIAAALVEMFPTRVRCSSVSLPYTSATAGSAACRRGQHRHRGAHRAHLDGLWYPVAVAATGALIALLFVRETKDRDIYAGDWGGRRCCSVPAVVCLLAFSCGVRIRACWLPSRWLLRLE